MLIALCLGIYAKHEAFRTFRDTVKTLVNNAKLDLIVINTNIAVENKTLAAMKKAADSRPDLAIDVKDLPNAPVNVEDLPEAPLNVNELPEAPTNVRDLPDAPEPK